MALLNRVSAVLRSNPLFKKHGKGGCDAMSVGAHVEQTCLKALIDLLGLGITWWYVETKSDVEIRWKAGNIWQWANWRSNDFSFQPSSSQRWRHVTTISLKRHVRTRLCPERLIPHSGLAWPPWPSPADLNGLGEWTSRTRRPPWRFQDDPTFIWYQLYPQILLGACLGRCLHEEQTVPRWAREPPKEKLKTPAVCKNETRFERTSGYPMLKNIEKYANFVTMLYYAYSMIANEPLLLWGILSIQFKTWDPGHWKVGTFRDLKTSHFRVPKRLDPHGSSSLQSDVATLAAQTRLNPHINPHASSLSQFCSSSFRNSVTNIFHLNITITILFL